MKNPWKKLQSKIVHRNPWFSIRKDSVIKPDSRKGEYNVVMTHGAVYIVPITREGKICMIRLFRYPTNMFSLELPAGAKDSTNSLHNAKRELLEETGYVAKTWKRIAHLQAFNGVCDEFSTIYMAQDLTFKKQTGQAEEGISGVYEFTLSEIDDMIRTGKITDAQTISALYCVKLHIKNS